FDEDIFPFAKLHEYTSPTYDFLSTIPLHVSPIPTVAHEQPTTSSHTPSPSGPTNTFSQGPIHHVVPEPINHAAPQPDITNAIQPTTSINTNTHMPPDTMPPIEPSTTNLNNVTSTQPQHHMQQPNIPTQTVNTHPMVTRAKVGISKPLERINCRVTTVSPLLRSHVHALGNPQWKQVMLDEYNALITSSTWVLVPRPANVNIVRSIQQQGIDYNEPFSLVVKPATIRTVLSLAVSRDWHIHQLDVKNAFLHGHLSETIYMHQPPGFVDLSHPDYVCHLQHSVYGLKQAPRSWFQRFASFVIRIGFQHSKTDTSLFVFHRVLMLLIYYYAWMISFSQKCNPYKTPVDTESKLGPYGEPVSDPTLYRSLAGALQYLTFTRPDIFYVVHQVCLYMHDPRDSHFTALKRILRYVRGTIDHGLQLHVSSTAQLTAYIDADWAGCPVSRRSISGYYVFFGDNLLSWSAKRQVTLSQSSAEAEYRGVTNVVVETAWLQNLLLELHAPLSNATIVYCDNVSAVYLFTNPIQHQRTKHIEIDICKQTIYHFFFMDRNKKLKVRRWKNCRERKLERENGEGYLYSRGFFHGSGLGLLGLLPDSHDRSLNLYPFVFDCLCHLAILCLDHHAHTLHHLESLLTISLDRLDILKFEHEHVVMNLTLLE
nr:hypothetical protein [Tanacetum cinerariifolium]